MSLPDVESAYQGAKGGAALADCISVAEEPRPWPTSLRWSFRESNKVGSHFIF